MKTRFIIRTFMAICLSVLFLLASEYAYGKPEANGCSGELGFKVGWSELTTARCYTGTCYTVIAYSKGFLILDESEGTSCGELGAGTPDCDTSMSCP